MSPRDQHVIIERETFKSKESWLKAARSVVGSSIWYWGTNSATLEFYHSNSKTTVKSFWVSKIDTKSSGLESGGYIDRVVN